MTYKKFSDRQITAMMWWKFSKYAGSNGVICDGAVRSGKTMSMCVGFVLWSCLSFDGASFAFCGKTIESLRRNVIMPMKQWLEGLAVITEKVSKNYVEITIDGHTNRFYIFGGRDESSASLIQGMTLSGVLLDEVALMPRSFVEQAIARCSVDGSKFWFNCNPESPSHWFYEEWIKKADEKNMLHLHFTMDDNPALSENVKERYRGLYTGVFYERFILGKWVIADGLIYPMFQYANNVVEVVPENGRYYISIDYGTLNPFSAGLWCIANGRAYRVKEYYYDGRKEGKQLTDEEYYAQLEKLAGDKIIENVIVDPSAASFIECVRRHGKFRVKKAVNEVLPGINRTANLITSRMILLSSENKDAIREFGLYSWDSKAKEDKPIKENDHCMDDIRYFVNTILRREFKWNDWRQS